MKTKEFPISAGVIAGIIFAAWLFFQEPRPSVCVFLQAPLIWFISRLNGVFPSESLAGLILVIPLWFLYWACLGALGVLLLRFMLRQFWKWRSHENDAGNATRDETDLKKRG
jgi:hypothetical protein